MILQHPFNWIVSPDYTGFDGAAAALFDARRYYPGTKVGYTDTAEAAQGAGRSRFAARCSIRKNGWSRMG